MFFADNPPGPSSYKSRVRRASVLSYKRLQADAPLLVAKGTMETAERIIASAIEAGVPITRSDELSAALMNIDLAREIPPELYVVVAEVLAWVWALDPSQKTPDAMVVHPNNDLQTESSPGL